MQPLATLPIFCKLAGRHVVIAGGSEAGVWKAELLAAAGAAVTVYAPRPPPELEALARNPPAGSIAIVRQPWSAENIARAALVVGATQDDAEAKRIFEAARRAGVPVNVIDKPRFCTFQFGSVINRSPLVIGISTDGAAPVLAQALRARIEALLPSGLAHWTRAAKEWRSGAARLGRAARRRFWQRFADLALAGGLLPSIRDRDACYRAAQQGGEAGRVTLVGAGPGDGDLLTVKALRALRSADVVLFDDLVTQEVLEYARREAKRIAVGKSGPGPSCGQREINALMVRLARAGQHVVRLKAGDPTIFARAGEEIAALRRAHIAVELVPGISAAQGAAARLGLSLTARGSARRVQFVTGHAEGGGLPEDLDWQALADPAATTAIYMPRGTLQSLVDRLLEAGVEAERCAVAIFNATRRDEVVVTGTVASIAGRIAALALAGPCLVLIGEVVRSLAASATNPEPAGSSRPPASSQWDREGISHLPR
jgi:uroporphyrin-III C-methyltransferase/precorrin-2 dehydrogenase/sirohydrochlorin ferrochelatase